jgi:5-hydroxyisourate hydrolase
MSLSTHVLDTARGRPAEGVRVICERLAGDRWEQVAQRVTDADGRVGDLVASGDLRGGIHRLVFATGDWAAQRHAPTFWPEVTVTFDVTAPTEHHHVPLLLSPYGYSTYRGS